MGESIHMLPSNMNLKIKTDTVEYNNTIFVSDEKFSLGKNEKVNAEGVTSANAPAMKSHKYSKTNSLQGLAQKPNISHKNQEPSGPHNKETLLWYFFWQVILQYGICFDESSIKKVFPRRRF